MVFRFIGGAESPVPRADEWQVVITAAPGTEPHGAISAPDIQENAALGPTAGISSCPRTGAQEGGT